MKRPLFKIGSLIACASSLLIAPQAFAAGPSISSVSPATATSNVPVTLTATVNSAAAIQSCDLYVDLDDKGAMTLSGSTASMSYTFTSGGSRIAFVFCKDVNGGMASGPNTAIWVEGAIVPEAPLSNPAPVQPEAQPVVTPTDTTSTTATSTAALPSSARTLLKLPCADGAAADDPCKAVYYIGADGERHAFPNGNVFFTWYQNFDQVQTVSQSELSAFPLGKNVTYRPGSKMVKFTTLNKVYAVSKDGTLHWITSEDVASALYGADWNKKIDDVPDTFFTDYKFGTDISSAADFNATSEMEGASTFD